MTFQNKTAIVTGAAQGIGFEICRRLAMEGANVLLNDIEPSLAIQAFEKITSENGNCVPFAGDCGDTDFIQEMVDVAVSRFGEVNIAIANATCGTVAFRDGAHQFAPGCVRASGIGGMHGDVAGSPAVTEIGLRDAWYRRRRSKG